MTKINKHLLLFLAALFLAAALLLPAGAAEAEGSRFARVISEYTNVFSYSGQSEHQHQFNFYNGMAGVIGAGRGSLGGSHFGWSVQPGKNSIIAAQAGNTQSYTAATAAGARPDELVRIIGGFSLANSHAVQSGVMPAPGSTGYVHNAMAVKAGSSGCFVQTNSTGVEKGKLRVESGIKDTSSSTVKVEGSGMYYESTVIDGGGAKTGWWDMQFSGEGGSW